MRLLFLHSLPRSGSTILQARFAACEGVVSPPETWMFLTCASFAVLRGLDVDDDLDVISNFSVKDCGLAGGDFLDNDGVSEDIEGQMYVSNKISQVLSKSGGTVFLEKTPRNYLIYRYLKANFKSAEHFVLLRNPLDIVQSMKRTWWGGHLFPHHHYVDLVIGVRSIDNMLKDGVPYVCYESIFDKSSQDFVELCSTLGITPNDNSEALYHAVEGLKKGIMGDPSLSLTSKTPKTSAPTIVTKLYVKLLLRTIWKDTWVPRLYGANILARRSTFGLWENICDLFWLIAASAARRSSFSLILDSRRRPFKYD